jgi:hypothetical protein
VAKAFNADVFSCFPVSFIFDHLVQVCSELFIAWSCIAVLENNEPPKAVHFDITFVNNGKSVWARGPGSSRQPTTAGHEPLVHQLHNSDMIKSRNGA